MGRGGQDTSLGHILALGWLCLDLLCLVLAQQPLLLLESITTAQQMHALGCLKSTATNKSKPANTKWGERWARGYLVVIHSGLRLLPTQVSVEQTSLKTSSSEMVHFKKKKKTHPLKSNKIMLLELGKDTAMSTGHRGWETKEQEEHKRLWRAEDAALTAAH